MLNRLGLPRPAAIQTSHKLWSDRLEGSHDINGYLQWHGRVCPGGNLHPHDGSSQSPHLRVRGKSVRELSQELIRMMDQFHRTGGNSGTDSDGPEEVLQGSFSSLAVFFNYLRSYIM